MIEAVAKDGFRTLNRRSVLAAVALAPFRRAIAAPGRRIALSFDDLPYAARPFPETVERGRRVTEAILATLARRKAPAIGLVNVGRFQEAGEVEASIPLLRAWARHGCDLGNHTYSHVDLNRVSAEQFEADVDRGAPALQRVLAESGKRLRYFRYPYNHTGPTLEKKQTIEAFLAGRGYRVAPHTIDSSDYIFDLPYQEALNTGDGAQARQLGQAYLDFVMAATRFAEDVTPKVVGAEIPQIILLHASDLTADWLDPLLGRFSDEGYQFVSLDEALADPAYATPDTLVTSFGPTWLWRWRKSKGLDVSFRDDPDPPAEVTRAYVRLVRTRALPGSPEGGG